jgi:hypothetical protein
VAAVVQPAPDRPAESLRAAVLAAGELWTSSQHRLMRLVAALDASGEWASDGAATCAHWVARALDVEICTARDWLRVGHALARLPLIDAAFAEHRLSYSKVRTLTRVATDDSEAELAELAQNVPAGRLTHALAAWRAARESPEETEARQYADRTFVPRHDVDGMIGVWCRLPPMEGTALLQAIDAYVLRHPPEGHASADAWPSIAQQRADALMALVTAGGARATTEVVLHIRADGCTMDDGTPIASSVVERIAPKSLLRALIHDA